jgi:hypothetical protein
VKASPSWTPHELEAERAKARAVFSKERLEEPLENYLEAFDGYRSSVENLLELTLDLSQLESAVVEVITDAGLLEAFRYLAGPPISEDDLEVLADTKSLSKSYFERSPERIKDVASVILQALDRARFPWVSENREATEAERDIAIIATSALMAASRAQTQRRTTGKKQQEGLVKAALIGLGFREVRPRSMQTISQAPDPGQFCGESLLGKRKADIVIRLWDDRVMPVECKVSNSSTNSVKRLNNDAAVKAAVWKQDFGLLHVVPSAVLSGVYKLHNLVEAQSRGLTVFWAHDLQRLTEWIESTRP